MSNEQHSGNDARDADTESEARFRTGLVRSIAHWLTDDAGRLRGGEVEALEVLGLRLVGRGVAPARAAGQEGAHQQARQNEGLAHGFVWSSRRT